MTFAGSWYASATLWAALAVFGGLTTGFFAGWATLRAANPKRQLDYWMSAKTNLLKAADGAGSSLEVHHAGGTLTDPHVLQIKMINKGRRDISSDHYDGGLPIRLDVGVQIVELLKLASEPSSLHLPTGTIDGTALKIGPSLIAKRQTITSSVLVDGSGPEITCRASLQDVDVREGRDHARRQTAVTAGGTVLGLGLSVVLALVAPLTMVAAWRPTMGLVVLGIVTAGIWAGAGGWWAATSWSRRRQD
ncbi:hypothetical protein AB0Q95_30025 [Streptomyces sp. NPDC059900]|uniref:hypothetical protein n=1 Tax=Streptomyces sp. NPDC059900 TaxID=3155816 RepID=UPI00341870B0